MFSKMPAIAFAAGLVATLCISDVNAEHAGTYTCEVDGVSNQYFAVSYEGQPGSSLDKFVEKYSVACLKEQLYIKNECEDCHKSDGSKCDKWGEGATKPFADKAKAGQKERELAGLPFDCNDCKRKGVCKVKMDDGESGYLKFGDSRKLSYFAKMKCIKPGITPSDRGVGESTKAAAEQSATSAFCTGSQVFNWEACACGSPAYMCLHHEAYDDFPYDVKEVATGNWPVGEFTKAAAEQSATSEFCTDGQVFNWEDCACGYPPYTNIYPKAYDMMSDEEQIATKEFCTAQVFNWEDCACGDSEGGSGSGEGGSGSGDSSMATAADLADVKSSMATTSADLADVKNGILSLLDLADVKNGILSLSDFHLATTADLADMKSGMATTSADLADVKGGMATTATDLADMKSQLADIKALLTPECTANRLARAQGNSANDPAKNAANSSDEKTNIATIVVPIVAVLLVAAIAATVLVMKGRGTDAHAEIERRAANALPATTQSNPAYNPADAADAAPELGSDEVRSTRKQIAGRQTANYFFASATPVSQDSFNDAPVGRQTSQV